MVTSHHFPVIHCGVWTNKQAFQIRHLKVSESTQIFKYVFKIVQVDLKQLQEGQKEARFVDFQNSILSIEASKGTNKAFLSKEPLITY